MKLTTGDYAYDFTATTIDGTAFKLSEHKGKKILLSFYRNVNCPFCNRRVHKIMSRSVQLRRSDVELVFLFESSNEKLSNSTFHQGISPWPLIGDPEKSVYGQYGVEESTLKSLKTFYSSNTFKARNEVKELSLPTEKDKDATQNLIPADILIDENFKVVKAHYGAHIDDHIDFSELKTFAGLAY